MSALLAAGLVASAVALGGAGWGRVCEVHPRRDGRWISTPVVWAGPGVDMTALGEAADWWGAHGQRFDHTAFDGLATVRVVVDPTLGANGRDNARTRVWASVDGVIVEALVRVAPEVAADPIALAHELGHAAGWRDLRLPPSGHVLNRWRPGWDGRGLEAR